MNRFANDNAASPDSELIQLLRYLDATAFPLAAFGCFVAVSQDETSIFVCPMLPNGLPEIDRDGRMNWSQVTAPAYEFIRRVNAVFRTNFQSAAFAAK